VVKQFKAINHPTQIDFIPDLNLLAIVEYSSVSLYDLRQGKGPTMSLSLSSSLPAYGLSCRSDVVAVGGASRNVSLFDTKMWKVRANFKNCVKYEITSIHLSTDSNYCYVADDGVIVCQYWNSTKGVRNNYFSESVRLESRHLGISHNTKTDTLMTLSEKGYIYVVPDALLRTCLKTDTNPDKKKFKTRNL